jgi:hypothetical protein
MAGTQPFTLFQTGKETTKGTPVAATRQWYPDGTGVINIDPMLSLHGGNRGTRTNVAHASTRGYEVSINYRSNPDVGLAFDELPIILNQADGGTAGSGASANKTWTWSPAQTAAPTNAVAHTIEAGDDVQFWEFEYAMARSFTISAARDGMTQLEVDWFARQPTKTTKTAVSANTAVRIPGRLWTPTWFTTQAGLGTAAATTDMLLDWSLTVQTGLTPRFTMNGQPYFDHEAAGAELMGEITFNVESTSTAVSQFYDKWVAQTVDFMQLRAVGPTLGTGTYIASIQMALLYTNVQPIASEQDGTNIYAITARTVYDSTWTQSIGGSAVCSISSLP